MKSTSAAKSVYPTKTSGGRALKHPRTREVAVTLKKMVEADVAAKVALDAACDAFVEKVKSASTTWRVDRAFIRTERALMLWKRGILGFDDSLVIGMFQHFAAVDVSLKRTLSYAFTNIVADDHGNINDHIAAMGLELTDAGLIAISDRDGTVCF